MVPSWKAMLIGLLALTLSASPALAYDPTSVEVDQEQVQRDPRSGEMFADAVLGRPLGFFALVLGTAAFVISLPFTIPSHSADQAAKTLINTPARHVFKRPLGRFASCDDQPEFCK